MDALPLLEITHVKSEHGKLTELGAVRGSSPVWWLPARTVMALYRTGVRFFVNLQGKAIEVYLDRGGMQDEPVLRTVADKPFDRKLHSLPAYAGRAE